MKVDVFELHPLFQKDVRYLIPQFQRPYVWEQGNQWEPLWDDVRGTAERYIEEQQRAGEDNGAAALDATPSHFIGAIVIQQQSFPPDEIERRLVIDGQQRLTTLQLLLDASQEVFEEYGLTATAKRLAKLVLNDKDMLNGQEDHVFKVWPTLMDQDAFRHAMRNDLASDEHKGSKIVDAHEFFQCQVREWIKTNSRSPEQCAEALQATMARRLNLVVIDLDMGDDPHIIFETLNARGTPLLQAELVKNFLLHQADDDEALHKSHLSKLENDWWRTDVQQGRIVRPRVDVFLNYWITMRRAEEVQAINVFSTVRKHAQDSSIENIAADIGTMADVYQKIQGTPDNSVLGRFLYRWQVMQVGVLTPLLMWLQAADIQKLTFERSLRVIESYLVRRMVCRMSTKGYANMSFALLKRLNERDNVQDVDTAIEEFLAEQTAEANLWPDDQRLQDAFLHSPLYRLLTRARLRLVLEGIEEQLRRNLAEDKEVPKDLSIEHVMPQMWRKHWPPPPPTDVPDDAEAQRDRLIHTVGNLTLITGNLNAKLKNGPWKEKRDTIITHSILRLKESITTQANWNDDAIIARSRYLAGVAVKVWPHATGT